MFDFIFKDNYNNCMKMIKKMYKFAKKIYGNDKSGHDFVHIKNVYRFAKKIQKKEGGDKQIILISALFHDLHRILQSKTRKYVEPKDSIAYFYEIIGNFSILENDLKEIAFIIENHENKKEKSANLELNIVKDADILDSLGKRGLKRTLKYCKFHSIPIVNKKYSLDCKEYIPDVNPISCVHYIYRTILKNKDYINTEEGRKIANKEGEILKKFIEKELNKKDGK